MRPYHGKLPALAEDVFVADTARIIGDVEIGEGSSVWYGAVLRGDVEAIRIGRGTNIQDCVVLHALAGNVIEVGDYVTIGHGTVLHGCRIGDGALVGMNSVILDGASVGQGSIVGAGTVVPQGKVIPPGSLVLGVPGKVVRALSEAEMAGNRASADEYIALARAYRNGG